jgi:hypothetical protein
LLAVLESELAADFPDRMRQWEADRERAHVCRDQWQAQVKDAVKGKVPAPAMPEDAVEPEKPVRPRLWSADATPEAIGLVVAQHFKGVLVYRDELAGWLGSFERYSGGRGGERAFWIEAYGGRPYVIDRVKHPEPIRIPHLSVGALGGVQPDVLAQSVLTGNDDGLSARFLFIWPSPVVPKRPQLAPNAQAALVALRKLRDLHLGEGDQGDPVPRVLRLTDEAANLFDEWRREHVLMEPEGQFASWWGKMPGTLLRLALVLELLWWAGSDEAPEPLTITKAAVGASAVLVDDYFKPMAERTYGDAALPSDEKSAATLARWILKNRPKTINARKLRREARLPGLSHAEDVRDAITLLVDAGWLRENPSRDGGTPGRQKADYTVNPKLFGATS